MDKIGVIYIATSLKGKSYIGQTVQGLDIRIKKHYQVMHNHHHKFANALKKYRDRDWTWRVLYDKIPQKDLNNMERWCITNYDTYINGYNSTPGGEGGLKSEIHKRKISLALTGKPKSKEHIQKMSAARKGKKHTIKSKTKMSQIKRGANNSMYGKKHSELTKQKISMKNSGRKLSEEHKKKISESNNGKILSNQHKQKISKSHAKHIYKVIKPDGNIDIVRNLHQYCKDNNLQSSHMSRVVHGKFKHHKGYRCKKIEK